ncbi:hypothetical protein MKW92_014191 [Papaver armeniacum]|nr:hypothetical protein MKW92_014191 [Papaver armeniacum]
MQSKKIGDGGASISIRMENLIANSIKEKLQICAPHSRISGGCSIHRVPERFHKMREPSAYKPGAVSIGPYHRGNQSLKATEDLKLLYAHKLLTMRAGRESSNLHPRTVEQEEEETRTIKLDSSGKLVATQACFAPKLPIFKCKNSKEETRTIKLDSLGTLVATQAWFGIVEECVSSIREMETKIRKCYSEPVDLNSKEFVEMMIIDGLFIIKMLIRSTFESYDIADDPLDSNDWLLVMVEQDMLLLENQIPLFVLQCLANIIFSAQELGISLNIVILIFIFTRFPHFTTYNLKMLLEEHLNRCEDAKHLLDFLILVIQPPAHVDSKSSLSSSWWTKQIPAKLKTNTLVKFTMSQYSSLKLFLSTKLKRTGITDEEMENPSDTSIDYFLPSATELSLAGVKFKKWSAQGSFLDIKFSGRTGILEIPPLRIYDETDPSLRNLIACEQSYGGTGYYITSYVIMMDSLINSADDVALLRKQGIISNYGGTYYSDCITDINKFYKKRRHIWKATLKREYFKSAWAIISVFAAVLLIALTIISTVFGILSFLIPKS